VVRKFGDGEKVEAPSSEKSGAHGATKLFQGSTDYSESILRSVGQVAPSLIGEANLEAVAGHCGLYSGGPAVWVFNPAPV
jgi:hypothetical protein